MWKNKFPKDKIYFETDNGLLYNADCVEILAEFPSNSIDLVITSPPYNLGIDYDVWNDDIPYSGYINWVKKWLKELYRVLKDDGRICINHYLSCGKANNRHAPLMDIHYIATREIGFKHHGLAIWDDRTVSRLTAFGSWLSASAPYINSPFEGILVMYKNTWKKTIKGNSTIDKETFLELTSGIWKMPPVGDKYTKANFPERLPEICIRGLSYVNDLVLDPFMGSGTVGVVAEKLERRWIGIEISENYCRVAKGRIKETLYYKKQDLFGGEYVER